MDKTYFDEMKQKIKDFRVKMEQEGKQFFLESSKILFDENPKLLKFAWHQYTPYFNDGDECVFSAALDYPNILVEDGGEGFDEDSWLDEEPYFTKEEEDTEQAKLHKVVVEFLSKFDDDDVKMLFDDHCQVVVSRDGVEVEEYSHD